MFYLFINEWFHMLNHPVNCTDVTYEILQETPMSLNDLLYEEIIDPLEDWINDCK